MPHGHPLVQGSLGIWVFLVGCTALLEQNYFVSKEEGKNGYWKGNLQCPPHGSILDLIKQNLWGWYFWCRWSVIRKMARKKGWAQSKFFLSHPGWWIHWLWTSVLLTSQSTLHPNCYPHQLFWGIPLFPPSPPHVHMGTAVGFLEVLFIYHVPTHLTQTTELESHPHEVGTGTSKSLRMTESRKQRAAGRRIF